MFKSKKAEKVEKKKETFAESISSYASVFVSGLFIIAFIVQAFEIPSESMVSTLLIGDHLFVDRLGPAGKPGIPLMPYRDVHRGDIIVFVSPAEPGLYLVKRVIGVPGDRIHLREGAVYRNGEKLDEPYVIHSQGDYNPYRDEFPSRPPMGQVTAEWPMVMRMHMQGDDLVIPPDKFFGMGDNRDVSLDSRFWGFIPRENIVGRPLFIYWSFDTPREQYERKSVGERAGFVLHVIAHFFDQTRWSRMFRRVR